MLYEVPETRREALLPLAAHLGDQGMAQAVLAGTRPGIAMVDSLQSPRCLFLIAPEGAFAWSYLAGDANVSGFREALNRWLFETYGPEHGIAFTFLVCDRPAWESTLSEILAPRAVIPDRRLHYECATPPGQTWHKLVPNGYEIRRLDEDLLRSEVVMHEKVSQWLVSNFGSEEHFLESAFGAVAVHENHVVAWCLPDSVGNLRVDIGVETDAEHQQRGLAYLCTCLVLEQAFDRGIEKVGWHCHLINLPSIRTARKAGFELQYEYPAYAVQFDPEHHKKLADVIGPEFVEQANASLESGDYPEAHALFARLLGFHQPSEPSTYVNAARAAAMLDFVDEAFRLLEHGSAVGEGLSEKSLFAEELKQLHADPRWQILQDRLAR